jgi:hypothetical protein
VPGATRVGPADGSAVDVEIGLAGEGAPVPGWVTWHADGRGLPVDSVAHLVVTGAPARSGAVLGSVLPGAR